MSFVKYKTVFNSRATEKNHFLHIFTIKERREIGWKRGRQRQKEWAKRENESTCWMAAWPLMPQILFSQRCKCSFPDLHKSCSVMRGPTPRFSFSLPPTLHPFSFSFSTALLSGRNSVAMVISIAVIPTALWGGPADGEGEMRCNYIPGHSQHDYPSLCHSTLNAALQLRYKQHGMHGSGINVPK